MNSNNTNDTPTEELPAVNALVNALTSATDWDAAHEAEPAETLLLDAMNSLQDLQAENERLRDDLARLKPFVRMVRYAASGALMPDGVTIEYTFKTTEEADAAWEAMYTAWGVIYDEDMAEVDAMRAAEKADASDTNGDHR